jgi:hypothetical protein
MPSMRFGLALLLAVALAAAAASVASGLSEPAYIKAANKICAQRAAKLTKLPNLTFRKITPAQLATRLRQVIPVYRHGTKLLRSLKVPRSLSFLVPRWLHYEELRVAAWRAALNAAGHGNKALARTYLNKSNLLGGRAAEISTGLEIKNCE